MTVLITMKPVNTATLLRTRLLLITEYCQPSLKYIHPCLHSIQGITDKKTRISVLKRYNNSQKTLKNLSLSFQAFNHVQRSFYLSWKNSWLMPFFIVRQVRQRKPEYFAADEIQRSLRYIWRHQSCFWFGLHLGK